MGDAREDGRLEISVHKAQPISGYPPVDTVQVAIGGRGEVPRFDELGVSISVEASGALMEVDARSVLDGLRRGLPGGTLDRLFALLVADRSSRLVVSVSDLGARSSTLPILHRGLGLAQSLLLSWAREHRESPDGALMAVSWLEEQLHGDLGARSVERLAGDAQPGGVDVEPTRRGDLMTWRDLRARLDDLAQADGGERALDEEVVMRIEEEDGAILHCGGMRSVDVEVGCDEAPALTLDGTTSPICADLAAFARGALVPARAALFRRHLSGCDVCMEGLGGRLDILARLSSSDRGAAGLRADHRALLDLLVHEDSRSPDAALRMRAVAVGAGLSVVLGGPMIGSEVARALLRLHRSWQGAEGGPSVFAPSLEALMEALGLLVEPWYRAHTPEVCDVDAFPGVRLSGCSCGWAAPEGATSFGEAFDLHAADAWADEIDAAHADCTACGNADLPVPDDAQLHLLARLLRQLGVQDGASSLLRVHAGLLVAGVVSDDDRALMDVLRTALVGPVRGDAQE